MHAPNYRGYAFNCVWLSNTPIFHSRSFQETLLPILPETGYLKLVLPEFSSAKSEQAFPCMHCTTPTSLAIFRLAHFTRNKGSRLTHQLIETLFCSSPTMRTIHVVFFITPNQSLANIHWTYLPPKLACSPTSFFLSQY